MQGFFITGTDTDAGKTVIAAGYLSLLNNQGHATAALKPLSSGCEKTPAGLRNQDALQLQKLASAQQSYEEVNPTAFHLPIAPHLAAQENQQPLSVSSLLTACEKTLKTTADYLIVEGCGGWQVPLNDRESMADFAVALGFPIILVVGMRLGCINHTLLTLESLQRAKVPCVGWVANQIDPNMLFLQQNMAFLKQKLAMPLLGTVPYMPNLSFDQVARCLKLPS